MGAWLEVFKMALAFLEKPTGLAVLTVALTIAFLSYVVPLTLVVGGFIYVGEKVVAHIDQGFTKMESVLERRSIAQRR